MPTENVALEDCREGGKGTQITEGNGVDEDGKGKCIGEGNESIKEERRWYERKDRRKDEGREERIWKGMAR